jgi:hypothetical protein
MSWQSLADVFAYVDTYVDTPQDKLTSKHVLVLHAIAQHTDQHGAGAYPTLPTLQRHTRLKRRTIQYALRDLEANKQVLKTVLQPGRYGRQTYQLLLPHVDINKGAPPAPFDEVNDALPAPLEHSKGAPPAQKGASPAPDPGLRSGRRENLARAPEEGDMPEEQPERHADSEATPQATSPGSALPPLPDRPDDVLSRLELDAATVATLETAARDVL